MSYSSALASLIAATSLAGLTGCGAATAATPAPVSAPAATLAPAPAFAPPVKALNTQSNTVITERNNTADLTYLAYLDSHGVVVSTNVEPAVVTYGYALCNHLNQGESPFQVTLLAQSLGFAPSQSVQAVIGASNAYCPQHLPEIKAATVPHSS